MGFRCGGCGSGVVRERGMSCERKGESKSRSFEGAFIRREKDLGLGKRIPCHIFVFLMFLCL